MKNKFSIMFSFSLMLIMLLASTVCFADNPIVQTIYTTDPAPMVYNGTCYVYTGHDADTLVNNFFTMNDWRCYSSTDMRNWTDLGSPLSYTAFSWAKGDCWAGQCIYRNNKFYYYVPMTQKTGGMAIGVAVSTDPAGPFTDALGYPLVYTGTGDIDPTVFIDDDGQAYLYWGNPNLWYVKLNQDMISYSGSIVQVPLTTAGFGTRTGDPDRPTLYEEGPWFYKRDGLYYMVFAASGIPENICYSTSPGPTGPWTFRGVIMPTQGGSFTNHPGIIDYNGNSYFFYHNGALPGGGGYHRSVCVEKFTYNADDTIPTINMTTTGAPQIVALNPYVRTEAETICWESGVETESCSEGGMNVGYIENGDWIKVEGVDFGSGATSFDARVASATSGGNIEIRLDSLTGTLVGTCAVSGTGDWQTWVTQSCAVSGATGVHDLYLKFTGGSGYLFNLNWYQFTGQPLGNLMTNPGMETGNTNGWAVNGAGSIAVSTAQKHNGSYSLFSTGRTAAWNGPLSNLTSVVQNGKTYTCSGWVRLDNVTSDSIIMTIKKVDGSGTTYTNVATGTGSNSSWVQLSGSYTLNVTGTLTELSIYFEGPASGVNYYLDDVSVQ